MGTDGVYDAVGNQTERPVVIGTISYNSFDLPTGYATAAGATSLTYDDAGERIRKVDPAQETLYFGGIYERITTGQGVEDRYYLSNAEGVFAVAFRSAPGQQAPEVRYVFTDALGSTDVITDEAGSVEHKRRSYDAFEARRNSAGGNPLPPPCLPAASAGKSPAKTITSARKSPLPQRSMPLPAPPRGLPHVEAPEEQSRAL